MSHQSEATLENKLIKQLVGLGYASIKVMDTDSLVSNLKAQLETFNKAKYSAKEFDAILNHLAKGNVFEKAKTLRDRFSFTRDNDETCYVQFYDSENWNNNLFQVTNQVTQEGSFINRYDVTLLVNGLPLVQIELKRRGIEIKEAFNQINRYQKHTFWSNHGLFQYVQLFVISNGVNTKYLANNELQSVKQTFFWADTNNKNIHELNAFANTFLNPDHLGKMIAKYIVINETHKILMALRPYQYFATEAIINHVKKHSPSLDSKPTASLNTSLNTKHTPSPSQEGKKGNAYIWHTTGSGKTLTSFKASQILMELPEVYKVVFVVDRKDLDYQTMKEFNSFKEGSVDVTDNTSSLVKQLKDDTKLVLTTIQKLNNAISDRYANSIKHLQNERLVFIFDECHRSQFGDTHGRITEFFAKSQLFGFTGTPIFAENSSKNDLGKRTTKDLFGDCLHKYVITDAIRDQNVLRFGIEYLGKYKNKSRTFIDIAVEAIDKAEVLNSPKRLEKIVDYIIARHDQKTFSKDYSALFAVSSIDNVIQYYDIFQKKKEEGLHDLRIATIFTYGTNEDSADAQDYLPADDLDMAAEPELAYSSSHTRDKLEGFIGDYNEMYNTSFSTKDGKQFEAYFKDISKRLKDREKKGFQDKDRLDIVIVVNMMLTGFDAKKVNTLYVDKNLKYHGLIQAYSRTNRILGEQKSQGNILAFRNLKKATDEAITLFSDKDAIEVVTMPPYEVIASKVLEALGALKLIAPTYKAVNDLDSEYDQAAFVQAFRKLMRNINVLASYSDFDWEDLPITKQEFEDYKTKYLDLHDKVKQDKEEKHKVSILDDIDFELELIHRDKINVDYIKKLITNYKEAKPSEAEAQKKAIIDLLGGDINLRSKRELIEKFIEENLPNIHDADKIEEEFALYWQREKVNALHQLCAEENLDKEQFNALIERYIYSDREPLKDDVVKCLAQRPSVLQAISISERIINKMHQYVETFVRHMVG